VASYPIGISTPLLSTLEFNLLSNPVQDFVTLRFSVPAAQKAAIVLYNISGMKEATLLDEILPAGEYSRKFELEENLPAGMYLVTVLYGQQRVTRKMISE
jgi:hypothetical protein